MKKKRSPFAHIKQGLEELLEAAKSGTPLEKRFKTSQVRKIKTKDRSEIISRTTTDPKAGGGKFE